MPAADDHRLEAWTAFLRAHARVTAKLSKELQAECGLPLTWYDVLLQLRLAGGQARMQELARLVLLSKSGLTRLADRMQAAGLVERRSCPDDRRGTLVALTPDGRRALRAAVPVHLRGIKEHFIGRLDDDELRALHRALTRVLDDGGVEAGVEPGVEAGVEAAGDRMSSAGSIGPP
jgi:DNA-binding MarR family transcriptional regulator